MLGVVASVCTPLPTLPTRSLIPLIHLAFQVSETESESPIFSLRENVAIASTDNGNFLKYIAYELINVKETM